jgi:curli biogenesis system outer membrane secretion channel CsgG
MMFTAPSRLAALAAPLFLLGIAACGGDDDAAAAPSAGTPAFMAASTRPGADSFDVGVARVGTQLAVAGRGRTVAVLSFPDLQNRSTDLGRVVAERLTTVIVQSLGGGGRVVERGQVDQLLRELELTQDALTTESAADLGRQLGADVVVLGTVGILDGKAIVSARAVNVADGSVAAAGEFVTHASSQTAARGGKVVQLPPPPQNPLDLLLQQPVSGSQTIGAVQAQAHACTRSGRRILCALTLRAVDIDVRVARAYSGSTATDNRGNTLEPTLSIGRERPTDGEGLLVAGVGTPTQVWVEGVPLSADTIARLQLSLHVTPDGQDQASEVLTFRGIPIIRP